MPSVPIYSKSPINAAKASGVTPETAYSADRVPGPESSATPSGSTSSDGYPAAKPGAVPSLREPTSSARYAPAPAQPIRTTNVGSDGPPPPQPGAVPVPPAAKTALGPPPKAGESQRAPAAPQVTPAPQLPSAHFPPQMAISAPVSPLSQRGTSNTPATAPPAGSSPVQLRSPAVGQSSPVEGGLGYPSGYHQNANVPAFTGYQQRASQEAAERNMSSERDDESVWSSAKKWASAAGKKLSDAESEVWRRINKE